MTTTAQLTGDYTYPKQLPKPPPGPHSMQQEPVTSEIRTIIRHQFSDRPDVFVSGEGYLCYDTRIRTGWLVPDLVVAFGVDTEAIFSRNGYVISEVGKPPDFVLEIASRSTGVADYTRKRDAYAVYGALEYWRSDPSGGRYHDRPLAGDLLVDGVYRPMPIHHEPDGTIWGHSPALGLDLRWNDGRLRFYDPQTERYLLSLTESQARASDAIAERDAAENRASDVIAERDAAIAEAAKLREQIRRLRGEDQALT